MHHVSIDQMHEAFYSLKRKAAPGVDGVTWQDYETDLESNLTDLCDRVHRGGPYHPLPSRRRYIPKADGRQRPLAVAALEDKIVQRGKLSEVLQAAGQPLTSRARFALFADEVPAEKRTRKLQPYVLLCDAIARALGKDPDLFLYEKLDGLNIAEPEQATDAEARKLSLLLERMARHVADKKNLLGFFDLAAQTPGAMNEWGRFQSFTTWTYLPPSFSPLPQKSLAPPRCRYCAIGDMRVDSITGPNSNLFPRCLSAVSSSKVSTAVRESAVGLGLRQRASNACIARPMPSRWQMQYL
jgi:hypothetical protein